MGHGKQIIAEAGNCSGNVLAHPYTRDLVGGRYSAMTVALHHWGRPVTLEIFLPCYFHPLSTVARGNGEAAPVYLPSSPVSTWKHFMLPYPSTISYRAQDIVSSLVSINCPGSSSTNLWMIWKHLFNLLPFHYPGCWEKGRRMDSVPPPPATRLCA